MIFQMDKARFKFMIMFCWHISNKDLLRGDLWDLIICENMCKSSHFVMFWGIESLINQARKHNEQSLWANL